MFLLLLFFIVLRGFWIMVFFVKKKINLFVIRGAIAVIENTHPNREKERKQKNSIVWKLSSFTIPWNVVFLPPHSQVGNNNEVQVFLRCNIWFVYIIHKRFPNALKWVLNLLQIWVLHKSCFLIYMQSSYNGLISVKNSGFFSLGAGGGKRRQRERESCKKEREYN